ncbi:hypothetical protein D3C74_49300 [compost metagenome]
MELYVLFKGQEPVVVTLQGKKQPKVYLSKKNANNAVSNMRDKEIHVVPFVSKEDINERALY